MFLFFVGDGTNSLIKFIDFIFILRLRTFKCEKWGSVCCYELHSFYDIIP